MKVIVNYNKPQYVYIANNVKKPYSCEIIEDVEIIIHNREELIIDLKNGHTNTIKQKYVASIVVKEK